MPNEQDMQQHGTGAVRSKPDYRYINVEHLAGAAPVATEMPANFHIDYSGVPDLYQRKIGACTCHTAAEIRIKRAIRTTGSRAAISARFAYAMSKIEDGLAGGDVGTYYNMPFKIGVKYGFATEAFVPNDTTLGFDEYVYQRDVRNMPDGTFEDAAKYRIPGYAQVGQFDAVSESQLKQGIMQSEDGVAIGLEIGKEWWTAADGRVSWAAADVLPIRKCTVPESGHAVTATGWETEAGTGRCKVYFRNHWSTAWADQDSGWFYLDEHQLVEAWAVSEIPDAILALVRSLPKQEDFHHTWAPGLKLGAHGAEVVALQTALKIVGTFPFAQPVTTYFGPITRGAVMDFQRKYNVATEAQIVAAAGEVGPKTCATLNKLFSR